MSDSMINGHEAVAEYSKGGGKGLIPTAKKHLPAVGWRLYYRKKGSGREMRYQSPEGTIFYSLLSACKWYVQKDEITDKGSIKEWHTRKENSDYICSVCHDDDGDLQLCDKCPSAYHKLCLGLQDVPESGWFCPSCSCTICKLVSFKHCNEEDNHLHTCVQCLHRYHIACLRKRGRFQKPLGNGNWFCSWKCRKIHIGLQNLVGKKTVAVVGQDNLEWRLYSASDDPECVSKLNEAVSIIHECFEPVAEPYNGRDTVEDAVFNKWSDLHRLNLQGFYTLALERNDQLIIVALVRIHGEKVAEMPLVATRFEYRRQGMCRILMNVLEKTLMELGIEKLVLPAAKSVLDTWENKFGFSRVNESERLNFVGYTFLDFYGTTLCQKSLDKIQSREEHIDGDTISEAARQHIQKLIAETSSNFKRKATDVFKYHKRRKMASNGSHCVCILIICS